ncbi:sensor domain-containing protein [Mycobacterium vicinigordonae]|uniref:Sensor domain-containing protein n=1 Tax=Mycobacterium vicinigordonae TaxID=1719132 RepID=A0A7D6DZR1_9MYCO|nr:sensor domain-containing protein [Mycobacterium vicinigordonae]QLL08627.1 sensor domain-containing protein [Mycobacterium vicinigordonae]
MASALARRAVFAVWCALAALCGCSHHDTNAAPAPAASRVDALIVSVEDVRRIANYEELTPHVHADLRHPPAGDVNAPGPCRAAGTSDLTFASGWTEFRSAGYSGVTDDTLPGGIALVDSVSQAVAIYPDAAGARSALGQLESSLNACVALHDPKYTFQVDRPDSTSLRITDSGWSHQYRVKNAVLMSVGVLGIEPADRIAATILDNITDRIK